jgi:hypothetical protein
MPRVLSLGYLTDAQQTPRATRKSDLPTKLDRAIATKAARLLDVAKLRVWAKAVKDRDQWRDRRTGQRVLSTRQLDPRRAEAHHIEPKDNRATRYDVRNGICLSYATHDAVERHQLTIRGTAFFVVQGTRYINGRAPVRFTVT